VPISICRGELRVEVCDEVEEFCGDGYVGQQMCRRWIDSSGRLVSWVVLAGDVPHVDCAFLGSQDGVKVAEDGVRLPVSAASFPPAFDDSFIVPINLEVSITAAGCDDGERKELEPHCFRPSDVSPVRLPTWE